MKLSLKYLPLKKTENHGTKNLWDNTNQISKISYRINSYSRIFFNALKKGVPIDQLLRARFAYYLKTAKIPPCIHIEFTNACNLKCTYCNYPLFSYPRETMNWETFDNCIKEFVSIGQKRIVVSGGEATLHPQFIHFSGKLAKNINFMSIVTNGQWKDEKIAKAIIEFYDLVEISIDAGGKMNYEKSRIGADYIILKKNLLLLKKLKKTNKSSCQINIRLMLRPSQSSIENKELKYWKNFCDTIMPQYILRVDKNLKDEDVYFSEHFIKNSFPKCTYPLRSLQIRANGDIPLCMISGSLINPNDRLIIGNINKNSISETWNGSIMNQYRKAHRESNYLLMPICRSCRGC